MNIILNPKEKEEFFNLAKERGYIKEEIIKEWNFLPLQEFLENGYISPKNYCELISEITGKNKEDLEKKLLSKNILKKEEKEEEKKKKVIKIKKTSTGIVLDGKDKKSKKNKLIIKKNPKLEEGKKILVEHAEKIWEQERKFHENLKKRSQKSFLELMDENTEKAFEFFEQIIFYIPLYILKLSKELIELIDKKFPDSPTKAMILILGSFIIIGCVIIFILIFLIKFIF